ncbi:MAG: S8 family serine peptidase [Candidatus Bathyarchaeia archaeon]
MKKAIVMSFILLSMLLLATPPLARTEETPNNVSLAFDVTPSKEEFVDMASLEVADGEMDDPTPFWVDIVNAEYYHDGGDGIYVAVLDTGLLAEWPFFFAHANIKAEWGIGFTHDIWWDDDAQDFMMGPLRDDRGFITKAFEGSGHGTHVTSTIVGYRFSTATADFIVRGVAPKATIIPVLVLDAWAVPYPGGVAGFTGGTWEMVSAGINYIADLAEEEGIKIVISMSLGGPSPSPMIEDAINYAISKGVIVVASAGNTGYAGMGWPGAYPQVISVGAGGWTEQWITKPPESRWWLNDVPEQLNTEDYWGNNWQIYLEDFSSRPNLDLEQKSYHLDVTTPGASIVGPYKGYFSTTIGYYYLWGTSMSTPHVSGIAAIILQHHPHFNQYAMEFILKNAAYRIPLACDGAWVYDPWYGLWHFEWFGTDWGAGWLQADKAMFVAYAFSKARFAAPNPI